MNEKLWAIFLPGPDGHDEYHAMPSHDDAMAAALAHNNFAGPVAKMAVELGIDISGLSAVMREWPYSADGHADELNAGLYGSPAAALGRIAVAAGCENEQPARVADIVCAALHGTLVSKMYGSVCHMMRAADAVAAGVESLHAAVNAYADALEEFTCAEDDAAVIALGEAESALDEHMRAVMGQVGRYGRRAERVRDVITQYQSDTAAAALSRLGDGSAQ